MAGLDAFEATTLFFFLVAWWVNPFDTNGTSSKIMRKRYRNFKACSKFIPGWLFGPVWFLLYSMMAVAMWLYFNYAHTEKHEDHHHYYDAIIGLMIVHYVLNKIWTMLFFTMQNYILGAADAVLIFLTAATLEVLVWIHNDGDNQGAIYAAGALLIPYALWTFYAMVLSIEIAIRNPSASFFATERVTVAGEPGSSSSSSYVEEGYDFTEAATRMTQPSTREYSRTGEAQRRKQPRATERARVRDQRVWSGARGKPVATVW